MRQLQTDIMINLINAISYHAKNGLLDLKDLEFELYHNFSKAQIPVKYWGEHAQFKDDLLVEVAVVNEDKTDDLHYHKDTHAICMILGEEHGVTPPTEGAYVRMDNNLF